MKQMKPFAGKWRIVEMEVWDQDYVDMEMPGYIRIGSDGTGRFQFGLVSGDIDGRVEQRGNAPRFRRSHPVLDRPASRLDPHSPADPPLTTRMTRNQSTGNRSSQRS